MDAIGKLDQDHADVVDHGASILRTFSAWRVSGAMMLSRPILVDALDEAGDFFVTEAFLEAGAEGIRCFDDVVEKCGCESGGGVQTHAARMWATSRRSVISGSPELRNW